MELGAERRGFFVIRVTSCVDEGLKMNQSGRSRAHIEQWRLPMFEALAISGFVAGAILGSRFRVFVLAPAMLFATVSTVAVSLANSVNLLTSFLAVLAVLASLQCGYVGGVVA